MFLAIEDSEVSDLKRALDYVIGELERRTPPWTSPTNSAEVQENLKWRHTILARLNRYRTLRYRLDLLTLNAPIPVNVNAGGV